MPAPSFLPLLSSADASMAELLPALSRIGPILIPSSLLAAVQPSLPPRTNYLVLASSEDTPEAAAGWLDAGASAVVAPAQLVRELGIPREKVLLDAGAEAEVPEDVKNLVSGVLVRGDAARAEEVRKTLGGKYDYVFVLPPEGQQATEELVRSTHGETAALVVPTSSLTLSPSSTDKLSLTSAFLAPLTSDRPDGLYPTIVSSFPASGRSLGLVYSSRESIAESISSGRGVYQSRKHGLWRKGETSGAHQDVVSIAADCDSDCLLFEVVQHGTGFCHLGTPTCFGGLRGLAALEETLVSRKAAAPQGSYTRRLFEDEALLRSKIMEEADELCTAQAKEDVAFEAADLLYFALTRCVSKGVSLADVEAALDKKAKKVTRRPGNAKPQWAAAASKQQTTPPAAPSSSVPADKPALPVVAELATKRPAPTGPPTPAPVAGTPPKTPAPSSPSAPIRMRTAILSDCSVSERAALLRRPVLNSGEMIERVKPIVEAVRVGGDKALLQLTAKLDKAELDSSVLRPPFVPRNLDPAVKEAIDVAYANVRAFHAAQADKAPLVVETMPGVVCSRFARPISRVGLYVPGGTAILPSSALMLGVPAQVAGCKEIVLATPPKPDGSIVDEVLYVAHLVGASTILKAGGAQAVAALAYGTETVPKVDKIFGPGNQWVTAAKMLVQNDTNALVAIDMPAGPSEVLVIADSTCTPSFVASDLLSQAEHGVDSQVVLVAVDLPLALLQEVEDEVDRQARALPRVEIARQSIAKSLIVTVPSLEEAFDFSNDYAPEHLILHLDNAAATLPRVQNAGSVFVGHWSPESCGDYASGTNHTLPTNGYARQYSGVNTASFQKSITSQELTKAGLDKLGPTVVTLAECEGLRAHANAVRVRLGLEPPKA